MKKVLLISLGGLCLLLGGIGVVLPLLPTTPFVLVAAGCFGASSPRLYNWLERSPYFGEYIRNYREHTGISRATRWRALIFLWLGMALALYFAPSALVRGILCLVLAGVSIHLLSIKKRVEEPEACTADGTDGP